MASRGYEGLQGLAGLGPERLFQGAAASSHVAFDAQRSINDPAQDEFLKYYRQHRSPQAFPDESPPPAQPPLPGLARARFPDIDSDYDFKSCYSMMDCEYDGDEDFGDDEASIRGSNVLPQPPPRPHHRVAPQSYLHRSPVSPTSSSLNYLTGILGAKMNFSDDSSRDSGHQTGASSSATTTTTSSTGSPMYRRRTLGNGSRNIQLEWPQQRQPFHSHHPLDHVSRHPAESVYSYHTAMGDDQSVYYSHHDYNPMKMSAYSTRSRMSPRSYHEDEWLRPDFDDCSSTVTSRRPHSIQTVQSTSELRFRHPDSARSSVVSDQDKPAPCNKNQAKGRRLCYLIGLLVLGLSFCVMMMMVSRWWFCQWNADQRLDLAGLDSALQADLIGQSLATRQITHSLQKFFTDDMSQRVVILHLIGWPGTGKSTTTSLIKSLFPVHQNVHSFVFPMHFSNGNLVVLEDVAEHIHRSCGYSLVIIEDFDLKPDDLVTDQLALFFRKLQRKQDSISNGTVILVTSTIEPADKLEALSRHIVEATKDEASEVSDAITFRERLTVPSFLELLASYDVPNPLQSAVDLPTQIVPFLPLTRNHVRQCIVRQLLSQGASVLGRDVNAILDEISFFTDLFPIFSRSGCKKVANKVDLLLGSRNTFLGFA